MLGWKQQGPAFTASVILEGGEQANAVVVGAMSNPRGAVLVRRDAAGNEAMTTFPDAAALLRAPDLIEIHCMQERAFGNRGLPHPVV